MLIFPKSEILKAGEKAIDLSLIPKDQHHLYNEREVTVPPDVLAFLAECEYPLSEDEIHMIEKKMDRAHNLAAPNFSDLFSFVAAQFRCE
jgi:hypothetical protein